MWGSNYPPQGNQFAQGAYSATGYAGYPPSSGPPPPPGQGYGGYGGYGQSAYNVNQYPGYGAPGAYGGGYGAPQPQYGQYPQPQQQGYPGYPGGGSYYQGPGGYGGYTQGPAVPGFTAPPQQQPPSSYQYQAMQNQMANQSLFHMQHEMMKKMGLLGEDEDEKEYREKQRRKMRKSRRDLEYEDEAEEIDPEEEKRKMEERLQKMEERAKELQEKLESDDGLKRELQERFVEELVRRQAVSGTFEPTEGTIYPFEEYDEEDPVAVWFEAKDDSIVGEKWNPEYDVQYLRQGIKGWGTDEAAIIAVVSTRCNSQRNRLLLDYKTAYGRDLIEDLHGDLSGKFRECVLALFETPARYDAYSVKKAIYGLGTNERTLIEIMMTRTNAQIKEMADEYNNITYHRRSRGSASLEEDLVDDLSGDFKRLLISAAQGNRREIAKEELEGAVEESVVNGKWTGMFHVDYTKLLNMARCRKRAEELYAAGQERWGTDEETFIRIFSTQDYYTMRAIWDEYVKISQFDPINAIKEETSGNFERGLLAIARNMRCRPMYFAERLYESMKGLGTDDSTLIRIIVTRSEIDMIQIKACFLEKYHQTLWRFIMDDTSGDYRKLLCGIVGKN